MDDGRVGVDDRDTLTLDDLAEERDIVFDAHLHDGRERGTIGIRRGQLDRQIEDLFVGAKQIRAPIAVRIRRRVVDVVMQSQDDVELAVRLIFLHLDLEDQAIARIIELARVAAAIHEGDDAVALATARRQHLIDDRLAFGGEPGRQIGGVDFQLARDIGTEGDLYRRDGL